ncbi:hypothetical protein CGSMWGv0288E_01344 [Gardnerella vaginalis 0288E]|nr:hypothetical protein CGSMWGv75712_00725 [Gardnerella vaginalis 75712]EIK78054.1 hypothetical protein CGSMWGv0288E_01344 [Gardnerella vaginalis 0288E]
MHIVRTLHVTPLLPVGMVLWRNITTNKIGIFWNRSIS